MPFSKLRSSFGFDDPIGGAVEGLQNPAGWLAIHKENQPRWFVVKLNMRPPRREVFTLPASCMDYAWDAPFGPRRHPVGTTGPSAKATSTPLGRA